jgi:hypothetical protein
MMIANRAEAIEWLTRRGLHAWEHNLWLGPAIYVSKHPVIVEPEGAPIKVLENGTIVHPKDDAWAVSQYRHGGQVRSLEYPSLEAAITEAADLVETGDERLWK